MIKKMIDKFINYINGRVAFPTINITYLSSGAYVSYDCGCQGKVEDCDCSREVFSFSDESQEGLADMLRFVGELSFISTSRYSKERVYIYCANGDKYEGKDKETRCPHCYRLNNTKDLIEEAKTYGELNE